MEKNMDNIYKMRLRRTGKRGNKVRSRNTRKRQTLRRKKRQSRRKLRGGVWFFNRKVKLLPRIINPKDLVDNIETISYDQWYDYIDLLKRYNYNPQEFYVRCNEFLSNVSPDSKHTMFRAFENHDVRTPLTHHMYQNERYE